MSTLEQTVLLTSTLPNKPAASEKPVQRKQKFSLLLPEPIFKHCLTFKRWIV
jgi:hypothetical protein